jgi:broad specificity phosphatase PhoE
VAELESRLSGLHVRQHTMSNQCHRVEPSGGLVKRSHWLRSTHLTESAAMLRALGSDETLAAQAHAWSQNREFTGKEALFARMLASQKAGAVESMSPEQVREIRRVAGEYAQHRAAYEALPPRTHVDKPADPMRPVPDLVALNASAKTQLTPQFIADMQARGYTYENTATLVNVRHGETTGNVVKGGYFAGGLLGPQGPDLTAGAKDAASALVPEMQTIAPHIGKIIVSPTDRAQLTRRLATQGVEFPPGTEVKVDNEFAEHHVGGFFGLKKPANKEKTRISGLTGLRIGLTEDGKLGVDKNNMPRTYVPPMDTVFPSVPRVSPVGSEGRAESWDQMRQRVAEAVQRDVLPELAQGRNVLIFSHQYVVGNQDAFFFTDESGPGVARDPLLTGHDVPNTAPQYWTLHVFRDASGHRIVVPAVAGQGQLAAPGKTPKGQTP